MDLGYDIKYSLTEECCNQFKIYLGFLKEKEHKKYKESQKDRK